METKEVFESFMTIMVEQRRLMPNTKKKQLEQNLINRIRQIKSVNKDLSFIECKFKAIEIQRAKHKSSGGKNKNWKTEFPVNERFLEKLQNDAYNAKENLRNKGTI